MHVQLCTVVGCVAANDERRVDPPCPELPCRFQIGFEALAGGLIGHVEMITFAMDKVSYFIHGKWWFSDQVSEAPV